MPNERWSYGRCNGSEAVDGMEADESGRMERLVSNCTSPTAVVSPKVVRLRIINGRIVYKERPLVLDDHLTIQEWKGLVASVEKIFEPAVQANRGISLGRFAVVAVVVVAAWSTTWGDSAQTYSQGHDDTINPFPFVAVVATCITLYFCERAKAAMRHDIPIKLRGIASRYSNIMGEQLGVQFVPEPFSMTPVTVNYTLVLLIGQRAPHSVPDLEQRSVRPPADAIPSFTDYMSMATSVQLLDVDDAASPIATAVEASVPALATAHVVEVADVENVRNSDRDSISHGADIIEDDRTSRLRSLSDADHDTAESPQADNARVTSKSPRQRLQELESCRDLLTDNEYAERRRSILKDI